MRNSRRTATARLADRLFVGGCTAAYLALVGAVVLALRVYAF
jgi:hypothetical protein